ncbi:MAG: DUF4382 domain-containing protein [Steroidobacteraceae bacterium]
MRYGDRLIAPFAVALLALSACSGTRDEDDGGNPPPPPAPCTATTCGEVVIGLTDADGDFLSYAVDVVSIELERENGSVVETLPERQRVDFVDLVDVTEFITAATIPNGNYVRAFIRLDYTDAEVSVEIAGGPAEAVVVDENGDALDVVDLELEFDDANTVVVASGTRALLQLEFDLEASHTVNIFTTPAIAVVEPFLVATTVPVEEKAFRVRGPLVSVDTAAGSYVVDLRPFNHPDAEHGRFTIETTADTTFEADGEELVGAAGLQALANAGAGTPTVAQGVFDLATRDFTADDVLAGDSVPGADFDLVIGNVHARNGNELTVRGGTVIRRDDSVVYVRGDIAVQVGSNTVVTQQGGGANLLDMDDISVGQRIQAFGDAGTSDVNPELDATAGRVRLYVTRLLGTVVNAVSGAMIFDLFSIDGRDVEFFDFSGTGGSIITDADPQNYEIDTGDLDVSDFEADEDARVFGFVTPFGAAPPDFTGETLVDFDELVALLSVSWGFNGTSAPFLSMGRDGFILDVANPDLGSRRFIQVGPRTADITTLGAPLTIEPDTGVPTLYAVARQRRVEMFRDFEPFADRVNNLLNGGSTMQALTAQGSFDADTTTLTANYVAIAFKVP